jgi:hypothetical protein
MSRYVVSTLLVWAALVGPAAAQGVGVRAGASVDPNQFYFGGHFETGAARRATAFPPEPSRSASATMSPSWR